MDEDEVKHGRQVYSAPRRFDLATVLAVTSAYALLFTLMRMLDFPTVVFIWFAGLFTVVAVFQAILFGGNKAREASIASGWVYILVTFLAVIVLTDSVGYGGGYLCSLLTIIVLGPLIGYLAGALVGGVFLIADKIRCLLNRKGSSPAGTGANSPWDEAEDEVTS